MSVVLDSSVALAWTYSDEKTPAVEQVLDLIIQAGGWVPGIWRLEVANALYRGIRQGRIVATLRDQALADLATLNITTDLDTERFAWNDTLTLADRFRLTLYDACYLELAQRRELPLATLDRDMHSAGRELGLDLLGV
jgi:predicted nucleic acid-binding protein